MDMFDCQNDRQIARTGVKSLLLLSVSRPEILHCLSIDIPCRRCRGRCALPVLPGCPADLTPQHAPTRVSQQLHQVMPHSGSFVGGGQQQAACCHGGKPHAMHHKMHHKMHTQRAAPTHSSQRAAPCFLCSFFRPSSTHTHCLCVGFHDQQQQDRGRLKGM